MITQVIIFKDADEYYTGQPNPAVDQCNEWLRSNTDKDIVSVTPNILSYHYEHTPYNTRGNDSKIVYRTINVVTVIYKHSI